MPERKKLLEGFKKFRKKYYEDSTLMEQLVKDGAQPDFFFINCIDPRSGAQTVFKADPGQLFGDRVMAALLPPYEKGSEFAASLTYAIKNKQVKHIIIMGHTQCGGIEALVTGTKDDEISGWMSGATKAFERAKAKIGPHDHDKLCAETEKQTVIIGLKNLMSYPVVKEAFENGDITLNGWLFDMKEGAIYNYNPGTGKFENMTTEQKSTQNITKRL